MGNDRSEDWFRQAENDLSWGRDTLAAGKYSQACFVAQQVAQKALKAVALKRRFDAVRSHSILEIAESLKIDGEVARIAGRLDQYYISARYPDALPAGAPFQVFSREQAEEALVMAAQVLDVVRSEVIDGHAPGSNPIKS